MPPLATIAAAELSAVSTLEQSTDFERVLRIRSRGLSQHFSVHHLPERPSLTARARRARVLRKLSTGDAPEPDVPVDDLSGQAGLSQIPAVPARLWLGMIVPKRFARRAVTRTLLKRQIRCAVARHVVSLAPGLWVVRLRAPFDRAAFPSAASAALKCVVRDELDTLLSSAAAARPLLRAAQ